MGERAALRCAIIDAVVVLVWVAVLARRQLLPRARVVHRLVAKKASCAKQRVSSSTVDECRDFLSESINKLM